MPPRIPRGVLNRNPTNIRYIPGVTSIFLGCTGSDGAFCKFDVVEHGFRAAARIITNYHRLHHINTIAGVISRWAPASDGNDVEAYINDVSTRMGGSGDAVLDLTVPATMASLLTAMVWHECGMFPYTRTQVLTGVAQSVALGMSHEAQHLGAAYSQWLRELGAYPHQKLTEG